MSCSTALPPLGFDGGSSPATRNSKWSLSQSSPVRPRGDHQAPGRPVPQHALDSVPQSQPQPASDLNDLQLLEGLSPARRAIAEKRGTLESYLKEHQAELTAHRRVFDYLATERGAIHGANQPFSREAHMITAALDLSRHVSRHLERRLKRIRKGRAGIGLLNAAAADTAELEKVSAHTNSLVHSPIAKPPRRKKIKKKRRKKASRSVATDGTDGIGGDRSERPSGEDQGAGDSSRPEKAAAGHTSRQASLINRQYH